MSSSTLDAVVVGGGIVGLAVAYRLLQDNPSWHLAVLEKESAPAQHQTGHNSGVLHSGIYYAPGSLKARTCREGRARMEAFCQQQGLQWRRCGKLIVAVGEEELPRLEALFERGVKNGVDCEKVGPERMREIEPHAAGIAAVHVKDTGVTDFQAVSERLAQLVREKGSEVLLSTRVLGLEPLATEVVVRTDGPELRAARVVNCGGLHSDEIAQASGARPELRIVPFRGEYRKLRTEAERLVNALIYPVPDPRFPFLGVHFTRTVHGEVKAGPTATLALRREGYHKGDFDLGELSAALLFPGARRLFRRHLRLGLAEMWRAHSERSFLASAQRLVPELAQADLLPGPSGVRAQAVSREGQLVDDFALLPQGRVLHVLNAPSPAATASIAIGRHLAALAAKSFDLRSETKVI